MLDILQFRTNIVRPVLLALGAHSKQAEDLLVGTAVQESNLRYLRQLNEGPARGLFQMEPNTHDDIWTNYFAYQDDFRERVEAFLVPGQYRHDQLAWNLAYATAMCRAHYRRVREKLPDPGDIDGLARYWKQYYNTAQGAGTAAEFKEKYLRLVLPAGDGFQGGVGV